MRAAAEKPGSRAVAAGDPHVPDADAGRAVARPGEDAAAPLVLCGAVAGLGRREEPRQELFLNFVCVPPWPADGVEADGVGRSATTTQ